MSEHDVTFSALYATYAAHVWRMARCFGVPPDQLEDVTQEVWMSAFRLLPKLDVSRPLKPWLTKVVWNHVRRTRRGYARRLRKDHALTDVEAIRGQGPIVPQSDREAVWTLELILDDLPAEQREVLLLCDGEGMSAPEVSEALGVQLNTVYSRLRLARGRSRAAAAALGVAGWTMFLQYRAIVEPSTAELERVADALAHARATGAGGTAAGGSFVSASKVLPLIYVVVSGLAAVVVFIGLRSTEGPPVERVEPPTLPARGDGAAASGRVPPPTDEVPVPPPPEMPEPIPIKTPSERKPTPRVAPSPPSPVTTPKSFHSLGAELAILQAADAALAEGMPTRALALLDEHRRDFPQGASSETRDWLRMRAHCARNDPERARKVALERPDDPQFASKVENPCKDN